MEERPPTPPEFFSSPPPPPVPPSGPPPEPPSFPWERPGFDFFSALFDTLKLLVTRPRRAFQLMPVDGRFGRPLGFAILVGWPGIMAATLWEVALRESMGSLAPTWTRDQYQVSAVAQIAFAACAPIWLPIVILLGSAFQHLFLMLVGGAQSGYAATFRIACYAQVAALGGFLPVCGGILSLVWQVVLTVIGLSAAHRITTGRAALAVLLPLFLCCSCIAIALALGGAAWLASMGNR